MKKYIRSALRPEKARGLAFAMAFFLLLSSLLAPVMPVVDAATISNVNNAQQADALQGEVLVPLEDDGDVPPEGNGETPPGRNGDGNGEAPPEGNGEEPINGNGGEMPIDDGMDPMDDPMEQAPKDATLRVHLAWCPTEADLSSAAFDPNPLLGQCTYQGPDVSVGLYEAGGSAAYEQSTMGLGAPQFQATFTFAPLHQTDWNLDVRTVPYIEEMFACEGVPYDENGDRQSNTKPYASVARSATTTPMYPISTIMDPQTGYEEHIDCFWFGKMPNHGILHLEKKFCPEALTATSDNFDMLQAECQDTPGLDVEIGVTTQSNAAGYPKTLQLNQGNGYASTLYDVPAGGVLLHEQGTPGYYFDGLFCRLTDWQNQSGTGAYEASEREGDSSFHVGTSVFSRQDCVIFNFASPAQDHAEDEDLDEYGTLYITKMLCPEPIAGTEQHEYAPYCLEYMEGVGFSFAQENGPTSDYYPTNAQGMVIHELEPGNWTVIEQIDQNYVLSAVFCMPPEEGDNTWIPQTLSGNSFSIDIVADATHNCLLFNEPYDAAQEHVGVHITKYECTSMMDPGEMDPYNWYTDNCTTYQSGITFRLAVLFGAPIGSGETDMDGFASIYDGAPDMGEYLIDETMLPDGYTAVAAFCRDVTFEGQTSEWMQHDLTGNGIQVSFGGNHGKECLWFNYGEDGFTPQQEQESNLTIYKWICPAGYDYMAQDADPMMDCNTPAPDGFTFILNDSSPNPVDIQTSTGDQSPGNGFVYFGGLEPGMHTITETQPAGYDSAFLWVCDAYQNQVAAPISAGWTYQMDVPAGMEITCHWMNVPGEDEGTSLTIYKWECPPTVTDHLLAHDYYEAECATQHAGVEFTVTDDNGPRTVYSDIDGVQVDDLVGLINIAEVIPDGYGVPAVFCMALNDEEPTSAQLGGGFVTLPPLADDDYQCWFYNILLDDFSLTLYKWQCPEGTMYGQMADYYSAECDMEHIGVPFQFSDNNGTQDFMTDANGYQIDGLDGQVILREMGLPGYGDPVVFCQEIILVEPVLRTSTNGIVMLPPAMFDDYQCFWYNIPEPESSVTIYKWRCPDGMPAEMTEQWFEMNCKTTPMEVDFTLTDNKGPRTLTAFGGAALWTDVATGAVQISEHIPPGFSMQPYLVCVIIDSDGLESAPFSPATVNGTWHTTITEPRTEIRCDWYNWYLGDGEITVHKRLCPEGYDRHAWNADPMMDCTETLNGITFMLDQPDPEVDLFSDTGDSIDSAVYFGSLVPGSYTISEMVNPGEYQDIFVWQCTGLNMAAVHPVPLSVGQSLDFDIVGGDQIECYWFNVPSPEYGYMVVTKYNCSTEKWVSDVYCYTNQTGQYFDLQQWNGNTWTTVQSGTTDVSGKVTFDMLDAGDYRLIEPNTQACLMKSSNITAGGNIGVNTGEGTTVYVYNCKTPPPPQKTPTKYPNTGVGPAAGSEPMRTPGVELAGLAGLLGLAMNRRRVVAGAGLVTAGAAATALPLLNAQELVPLDSTPAPGTPDPSVFWCATPTAATPDASSTPDANGTPVVDPCNRGPIPTHMRIPIIGVDAPMEYLEIIDGLMEQPTGDTHIAWYKETSRLGEVGNGIYAAHVNWYGNPEGIFYRLESLQEGDVIEIDGDDQQTYLFEVQWMQDFPSDEEPPDEALGLTDEVAITLITCGGEWSSALSEYDHRTLVRAVLRE